MRLGKTADWKSIWYTSGKQYSKNLLEDIKIREIIHDKLLPAGLDEIEIRRPAGKVIVVASVARPGVVIGRQGAGIEDVKKVLKSAVSGNVDLRIKEVKTPELSPRIVASTIVAGIEKRQAPKLLANSEIKKVMAAGAKGVMIWVSGRIRGQKDARRLKFHEGAVPLQTIRNNIVYAMEVAKYPKAGLTSVKVWIYK